MSDMLDDINKFAKIWDSAQEKGIFDDMPKPAKAQPAEDGWGSDFFGQNYSSDVDGPINESEAKYWSQVSRMSDYNQSVLSEEVSNKSDKKELADRMAKAHNPVYPNSLGKDQDIKVTQNWGVGGQEHFDLEDLKVRLEKLESKLNATETEGKSGKDIQKKIDDIKSQIDDLSDILSGDRSSESNLE